MLANGHFAAFGFSSDLTMCQNIFDLELVDT